ncbi:hypothetical protein [Piscirickettsia salmonis]|uniref:hypothetical protein n=1 Tax=Piscirickettsia salmonis TaxID=1238 RepID=UPI0012BA807C|nr:hypothetical protein [Piscirickettsia salmonis]QGP59693.1 hypothetical protein PsalBI1_02286 [Piscirickettsia salmonis]
MRSYGLAFDEFALKEDLTVQLAIIKASQIGNKFAQNSIYLSSQQATRYFGKLPLRVVMRFVFFRSKLRGIRPLAIDDKRVFEQIVQGPGFAYAFLIVTHVTQQELIDTIMFCSTT